MPLIDTACLMARLGNQTGRFDIDVLESCDSTSSELMRRAERGAPAGTVIVADRQTAGRGRRGRSWLSDPESSLTFSLLWRFPSGAAGLSGLSLAVGLGLALALEKLGAQGLRLKWPNDVLLATGEDFAKLAGILIELASDRRGTQAVIGIGLNLRAPASTLDQAAAGLADCMADLPDRALILAEILSALLAVFETFAVDGFAGLKSEWLKRHAWQDRLVRVQADAQTLVGCCRGVDDEGVLLLETSAGIERVLAGDVSLRPA